MSITALQPASDKPRSKVLAAKIMFNALRILKEAGGQLTTKELRSRLEKEVNFDDWAKAPYEKTGNIRWHGILQFYSIDTTKAGFIIRQKGSWILTPEGEDALTLGEDKLFQAIQKAYKDWKDKKEEVRDADTEISREINQEPEDRIYHSRLDEIQQEAYESITRHIALKNAYEFQDMVAALLRGMGYYTPFIAAKGKDGGLDLIAYKDPLGTISPRIKVQVKHRQNPASVDEVRQLMGLLQKDTEVGIFVSTGGFTSDSKSTTRNSHSHVELIDLNRFVDLWAEFYDKISDDDKLLLPLKTVHFYAPDE